MRKLRNDSGYVALSILFIIIFVVIVFVNNRIAKELDTMSAVSTPVVVATLAPAARTLQDAEYSMDGAVSESFSEMKDIDSDSDLAKQEHIPRVQPVYEGPMDEVILPQ